MGGYRGVPPFGGVKAAAKPVHFKKLWAHEMLWSSQSKTNLGNLFPRFVLMIMDDL